MLEYFGKRRVNYFCFSTTFEKQGYVIDGGYLFLQHKLKT